MHAPPPTAPYRAAGEHLHGSGPDAVQTAVPAIRQLLQQACPLASVDPFAACGWLSPEMIAVKWLARWPLPLPQGGPVAID